jgi:hypothetical protein
MVNQSNAANPQQAVRVQNAGTGHAVSIFHDPAGGAGDPTAEALDIVSTNAQDTALGVRGREAGKGTVKITHAKPDGPDANAAALSIALEGAGTACQGIYIGNDAGNPTTGNLLHIRNGGPGAERMTLTADGRLELPARGPRAGVTIGATLVLAAAADGDPPPPSAAGQARIYVKHGKLVVQWSDGSEILYTTIPLDTPGPYPVATAVTTNTAAP